MRSKAIKALRVFHKTDRDHLAQCILLPHHQIKAMEDGEEPVTDSVLRKYSAYYDIPVGDIDQLAMAMGQKGVLPAHKQLAVNILKWAIQED